MREHHLKRLLHSADILNKRLTGHLRKGALISTKADETETVGHVAKAYHNLQFTEDTLKQGYTDWALVGCYYVAYHMALALILTKGYSSKNHDATLCALIKHYYRKLLTADDFTLFNSLYLDEHDILFYVQSLQERKKASYSSKKAFDKKTVSDILLKTHLFVNKCKEMLEQQ